MMTRSLRSCAGCSAHILTDDKTGEYAWCPKCKPKLRRQWPWLILYWCGIVMLGACVTALGGMLAR